MFVRNKHQLLLKLTGRAVCNFIKTPVTRKKRKFAHQRGHITPLRPL